jgi:hypothetical protein
VRARGTTHVRDGQSEDVRVRCDAVREVEHVLRHVPDVREDRVVINPRVRETKGILIDLMKGSRLAR